MTSCLLSGLAFAANAGGAPLPLTYEISDVIEIRDGLYSFETTTQETLRVNAARASMAGSLIQSGALSQDYYCSFTRAGNNTFDLLGCDTASSPLFIQDPDT